MGEAARQTGRSKSQISRAIRAGQLSAERSAETASFRIERNPQGRVPGELLKPGLAALEAADHG
jgi:hypothetical protein